MDFDSNSLPRYDLRQEYLWNYDHPPDPVVVEIPGMTGNWTFLGRPVASPLGIAAGPLLNGAWILYYASLGFDVLTYKTVRSVERDCYSWPNLVPVRVESLHGDEETVEEESPMRGSWAVSFGMPSMHPEVWRRDIEQTRKRMSRDQTLSVSVVGTTQPGWTIDELADDYALCARWAVESGADCIETNFSCPNVSSRDGQLYHEPMAAGTVAERVRTAIGQTPFVLKIGHVTDPGQASALLDCVADSIDGLAMTNSVATRVRDARGQLLFDGEKRGICGDATRHASLAQTKIFADLIRSRGSSVKLIAVGGASTAEHVRAYLNAGAEAIHVATAAMVDPYTACRIKSELG